MKDVFGKQADNPDKKTGPGGPDLQRPGTVVLAAR